MYLVFDKMGGDIVKLIMEKMIKRELQKQLVSYMKYRQIVVITGMRRVGKTTLLRYLFNQLKSKNKIYFDFEDILIRKLFSLENYSDIVMGLLNEGLNLERKTYVFIDEVQYVKNAPSVIKYLYDKYNVKFVVTGSSSYYLKNHFTESLAGRKFVIKMNPLSFREFLKFKGIRANIEGDLDYRVKQNKHYLAKKLTLLYEEYMQYGGFPEVVLSNDIEQKKLLLRDIINSYFQIDVASLTDVGNISKLRDLLILLTQRVGQNIQISSLSSALKSSRYMIYEYLELLRDTFIIDLVSQATNLDNSISAEKKLYFSDNGLLNILGKVSKGSIFENSVFMNLREKEAVFYYKTKTGGEIDFVIGINGPCLECKITPSKRDVYNLKQRSIALGRNEYYVVGLNPIENENVVMAWDVGG